MFIDNKYKKWYFGIIEEAKSQNRKKLKRTDPGYVYYESHHIIPDSMGGTEEVLLTAKEHFICHLLLPKMLHGSDKYKMINALIRMTFSKSKGQERYCSRSYNIVRSFIAEKNSAMFKDKPKSEKTKSNMKGRSGTWERTEEHKEYLSQIRQGSNKGQDNPFYGKSHKKESIEQRTKTRRENGWNPSNYAKGTKWYTNGVIDKMCKSDNVPDGFIPGRTNFKRRKKIAPLS